LSDKISWETVEYVFMKINDCTSQGMINWAQIGQVIVDARKKQRDDSEK